MSDRDPIWIEGPVLAEIRDFSLLTQNEKEVLVKFQFLFAKYQQYDDIYRKLSKNNLGHSESTSIALLNNLSSMSLDLYKLLCTDEIKHILELYSLGKISKGVPKDYDVKDNSGSRTVVSSKKNKKSKIIKLSIIIAVVILIVGLIIGSVVKSAHNSQLRNFATETMNEDYNNVYADIVSMEPEYFIYTSFNNQPYDLSEIVCKCTTVEGKSIWVAIDVWEYPGGSSIEENNLPQYYSTSNPKRIYGRVSTAGQIKDTLENRVGNIFVLDVTQRIGQ